MKNIINKLFELIFKRPLIAENGDVLGRDNDNDGEVETKFVKGYTKEDGTYVQSHYRKK